MATLRQYSQIIAGFALSAYGGLLGYNAIGRNETKRENFFQLKNEKGFNVEMKAYVEDRLFMQLLRLKWSTKVLERIEFFHTNSIDYLNLGYVHSKTGALCGIPLTHLAAKAESVKTLYPRGLYIYGKQFSWNEIESKLGERTNQFLNSLVLSEQSKSFAVIRELNECKIPKDFMRIFSDVLCYGVAYSYCYSKNRSLKFNLRAATRYWNYTRTCLVATGVTIGLRYLVNLWAQYSKDSKTLALGVDMSEGGIEYYTKLIERNKLLREFMENGHDIIDENGEFKKKSVYVPYVDEMFFINNFDMSLETKRQRCKESLQKFVQKPELTTGATASEDKELAFFKTIRESIQQPKKNE